MSIRKLPLSAALLALFSLTSSPSQAVEVRVTVQNLAPDQGVFMTPFWLGFHDGSFDVYDRGQQASPGLEAIAEDGVFDAFRTEFATASSNGLDTVVLAPDGFPGAPVFDPGDSVTTVFDLDPATQGFLSYAAMVLPSNDAFVANGNPQAHPLFDESGNFATPISFVIYGEEVLDAGTEANTESDAAFFNQSAPDTGQATTDVIDFHPGFNGSLGNPDGTPVVFLGGTSNPGVFFDASQADFTTPGYQIARITVAPATVDVRVTVENLRPQGGTFLTPVWIGAHDGTFDLYDLGAPATPGLESLAEDGSFGLLSEEFLASQPGGVDSAIFDPPGFEGAPVVDPGNRASAVLAVDAELHSFLSFASMVIPSNDAFVANGNPTAIPLFTDSGAINNGRWTMSNQRVRDAGTELNDESEAAFLNQSGPNTGTDENGTVGIHPGFNGSSGLPDATPVNILGGVNGAGVSFDPSAADFTRNGQLVAAIEVSPVVDASFGGTWVIDGRSGEGLLLELVDSNNPTAVVSYYTYAANGSGDQIWLIGSGPVINNVAIADLVITDGATFGAAFDPATVIRTPFGQVRITFNSCTEATLDVDSSSAGFESAAFDLVRLTPAPLASQGHCR